MSEPGAPLTMLPPPGRYVLPLRESRRESPTVRTFRFATAGSGFQYRSNQFIRLALPGVPDPWGAVRSFSLSSSPTEKGEIAVTCKITDTPFKQALARLNPGESAEVVGPLGRFLLDRERPSLFLAGGIGITPFRGMLRFSADTGDRTPRSLLYTARVPEELVFRAELDALAAAHPWLTVEYSITRPAEATSRWSGRVGRLDADWIRAAAERLERPRYYVVGLPEMVSDVAALLQGPLGIDPADISYELFRGY